MGTSKYKSQSLGIKSMTDKRNHLFFTLRGAKGLVDRALHCQDVLTEGEIDVLKQAAQIMSRLHQDQASSYLTMKPLFIQRANETRQKETSPGSLPGEPVDSLAELQPGNRDEQDSPPQL